MLLRRRPILAGVAVAVLGAAATLASPPGPIAGTAAWVVDSGGLTGPQARQSLAAPSAGIISPTRRPRRGDSPGGIRHYIKSTTAGATRLVTQPRVPQVDAPHDGQTPAIPLRSVHADTRRFAAAPAPPTNLGSFQAEAQDTAIGTFGSDQALTPPDPNLAVGPNDIVEAANSAISVFTRGGVLESSLDINALVSTPAGWGVTDPRVVYDAASNRFFLSVVLFDNASCANNVVLLRTDNADPTGAWHGFVLNMAAAAGPGGGGPLADQPSLGFTSNVVTVTWNYFDCNNFALYGNQADVVQKSDLIALNSSAHSTTAFFNGPIGVQATLSLGSISVQYVVFNNSDTISGGSGSASIGVQSFSGTPEGTNVTPSAETDVPIRPTTVSTSTGGLDSAPQQGTATKLETDDDRLLNAVWQNGKLWTSGGTNCTPASDTTHRACLNVVNISASATGTVSGDQQLVFGVAGAYLYYPAVSIDNNGNAVLVFDESSSSAFESIAVAAIVGGALSSFATLHTSASFYNPGSCSTLGCRWGDYSGAAQDPSQPNNVWVVSEDTDNNVSGHCSAHQCWNTFIGEYTAPPPPFAPQGVGAPQVVLTSDGSQLVFWQGGVGHLFEAWWNGHWNGPVDWTAANGWAASLNSAPGVAVAPDGTQLVFWEGPRGHLMEAWWNGHWNGPVDWTSANGWGAALASAPNVTFAPDGTQLVFWQGSGGHLIEAWWNGHWNGPVDWSAANSWGAPLASAPSVAIGSDGTQLIFWQSGGHLLEAWWQGHWNGPVDWSAANHWSASLVSSPNVAIAADGTQVIFWEGANGHLDEAWWQGSWNGPVDWTAANGWRLPLTSAPSVALESDGTQLVFWQDGGHLIEAWWQSHWNGPVDWSA